MASTPPPHTTPTYLEVLFPINVGTVPSWVLIFLWSIGVCWWFARPFKRALLLHLGYFLMLLFPATIIWSFVVVLESPHFSQMSAHTLSPQDFPQNLESAITQAIGLAILFTVIVLTSAILFLANLELSCTSYRSTSDDSPPEDQD